MLDNYLKRIQFFHYALLYLPKINQLDSCNYEICSFYYHPHCKTEYNGPPYSSELIMKRNNNVQGNLLQHFGEYTNIRIVYNVFLLFTDTLSDISRQGEGL